MFSGLRNATVGSLFSAVRIRTGLPTGGATCATLFHPIPNPSGYDGEIQNSGLAIAPIMGKPYDKKQLIPLLARLGFT
jgi:hypothetical protein